MTLSEIHAAGQLMIDYAYSVGTGKPLEIESLVDTLEKRDTYKLDSEPSWDWQHDHFRRKPTRKRVPLEAKDVPPGSAFRHVDWYDGAYVTICEVGQFDIRVSSGMSYLYGKLSVEPGYQIKRPTDTEWMPWSKEVES